MSKELQFPGPDRDREIADALDPILVPPVDTPAYWNGLHQRIMARIAAATPDAWWSVSPAAARIGLLAAGLALLALGALALQTKEYEARLAFDTVIETPLEVAGYMRGVDEPPPRPLPRSRSASWQR